MQKNKIGIILGTRPEIIKLFSIIKECEIRKLNYFIIHTNQHYSAEMDKIFFEQLRLPNPKYSLNIGSARHGKQTGLMLEKIEGVLIKEKPGLVLVQGDTNTVLAGALAATKLHIKVGHIEAGLRSYDKSMPEEVNRILTDHCSDYLFAPTEKTKNILLKEGVYPEKIYVTGNTIVDAVYNISNRIEDNKILKKFKLDKNNFFLLTIHRQENVDNKKRLISILSALEQIFVEYKMPIIYPIHPRTKKMIKDFSLSIPEGLIIIDPIGYLDFVGLEKNASLILTDSGGVQEEACILRVPCITLRDNTERPETIEVGANIVSGIDLKKILESVDIMLNKKRTWNNPFGDGKAANKILTIILNKQ